MKFNEQVWRFITRGKLRPNEAIPRMLADIILLNLAFIIASVVWFGIGINLYADKIINNLQFASTLLHFYLNNTLYLTLVSLIVFHFFGFYTQTKSYRGRYKAWVIIQAVTLSYLCFFFVNQFFFKADAMIRGVIVFGWLFTLPLEVGSRFFKAFFFSHFRVESKYPSAKERIKRILVIGGAGYMGSVLVRLLLEKDYKVRVLDNLLYGSDESIKELYHHVDFEFIKGDLRDLLIMGEVLKDVDVVIHLGAIVGDPASSLDENLTNQVNTIATMMIMKLCKIFQIKRFLFASTCSIYGASNEILDERSHTNPLSPYAKSKLAGEKGILNNNDTRFHPTILRFATLFGQSPRPRNDLVVNILTAAATMGKFTIFGGDQWRPFIHVEDVARAFIAFLETPLEFIEGEIFNVGSNDMNFKIKDIGEKIKKVIPNATMEVNKEGSDHRNYRVSFDKINQVLGFTCKKTIEDGVRGIKEGMEGGLIKDFWNDSHHNFKHLKKILPEKDSEERFLYLILEDLLNSYLPLQGEYKGVYPTVGLR